MGEESGRLVDQYDSAKKGDDADPRNLSRHLMVYLSDNLKKVLLPLAYGTLSLSQKTLSIARFSAICF